MMLVPTAWRGVSAVVAETPYMRKVAKVATIFLVMRLILVVIRVAVEDLFGACFNCLYTYIGSDIITSMRPFLIVGLCVSEFVCFGSGISASIIHRFKVQALIDSNIIHAGSSPFFSTEYPLLLNLTSILVIGSPLICFGVFVCAALLYRAQQDVISSVVEASDMRPLLDERRLNGEREPFEGDAFRLSVNSMPAQVRTPASPEFIKTDV
eukprot:GHVO01064609.1.p1 GENE.GHVO01064609.1~~GHVO01064609.1.p1  ORF type:complete len:210 (+),score=16.67 GHVO01064609.1:63-692(+)